MFAPPPASVPSAVVQRHLQAATPRPGGVRAPKSHHRSCVHFPAPGAQSRTAGCVLPPQGRFPTIRPETQQKNSNCTGKSHVWSGQRT
jgi:hypothetical protein